MPDDHLDYIRAIVRHRVPEATEADLALMAAEPDAQPAGTVVETAGLIMDVLDRMTDRLDALVAAIAEKDDGDHDRRRARQAGAGDP